MILLVMIGQMHQFFVHPAACRFVTFPWHACIMAPLCADFYFADSFLPLFAGPCFFALIVRVWLWIGARLLMLLLMLVYLLSSVPCA